MAREYDFSKAKEAGEPAGFAWSDEMADLADKRLQAVEPRLTQAQVDQLLMVYCDALVFFTTGKLPEV